MNPFSLNAQLDHGRVILTLNQALSQVEQNHDTTDNSLVDTLLCFAHHEDVVEDIQHLHTLLQRYLSIVTPGQLLEDKKHSLIQFLYASRYVHNNDGTTSRTLRTPTHHDTISPSHIETLLFGPMYQSTLIPDLARNEDDFKAIEMMMYHNAMMREPTLEWESNMISLFLLVRTCSSSKCDDVERLKVWHALLTQRTSMHQAGMFRKSGVKQVKSLQPPAHHLIIDKIMTVFLSLVSSLQSTVESSHSLESTSSEDALRNAFALAAFVHYHFMDIQPFYQGNALLARVLSRLHLNTVLPIDIPLFESHEKYMKLHARLYQQPTTKISQTTPPTGRQRTLSTRSLQFFTDPPKMDPIQQGPEYPYVSLSTHVQPESPMNYADHLDTLSMHESIDQLYQQEFTMDAMECHESPLFAPLPIMKSFIHSAIRHFQSLLQEMQVIEQDMEQAPLFDHKHRIVTAVSSVDEFKQLLTRYAPRCPSDRSDLLVRVFESMPLHTEMDFDLVGQGGPCKANTIRVAKYPSIPQVGNTQGPSPIPQISQVQQNISEKKNADPLPPLSDTRKSMDQEHALSLLSLHEE